MAAVFETATELTPQLIGDLPWRFLDGRHGKSKNKIKNKKAQIRPPAPGSAATSPDLAANTWIRRHLAESRRRRLDPPPPRRISPPTPRSAATSPDLAAGTWYYYHLAGSS